MVQIKKFVFIIQNLKRKNQTICLKDEDCLSNYCSRKMNLCIPEPENNNKSVKYCTKISDCKRGLMLEMILWIILKKYVFT